MREETLLYAGWVILMTTLGKEYKAEALLKVYRSRWQIELLFKRIKQSFAVTKLPPASLRHSKVMILLWLILWSLTEQNALAAEVILLEKGEDMTRYSPWSMHNFLFLQLKTILNSQWALAFDPDTQMQMVFQRLRQNHQSLRVNQYTASRFGVSS